MARVKRDYGQAKGPAWTPFAAPKGQQDIADDVKYDAYDRAKRSWITHKPKR